MDEKIFTVSRVLRACSLSRKIKAVREALPGETPTFVQDHDKLSTGMMHFGVGPDDDWSCDFSPPVQLKAGTGYIVEFADG